MSNQNKNSIKPPTAIAHEEDTRHHEDTLTEEQSIVEGMECIRLPRTR